MEKDLSERISAHVWFAVMVWRVHESPMQTELPTVKPSQLVSKELSLRNRSMAMFFEVAIDMHVSPDFTVYAVPRHVGRGVPVVGAGANVTVE